MLRPQPTSLFRHCRSRGFSLIEVAVILMVIGIALAFIVPQALSWMRLYRLGVGARNVATALQRARYLATSNNTRAGVSIPEPQHIRVEQYDQITSAAAPAKVLIDLPNGITVEAHAPRQIAV